MEVADEPIPLDEAAAAAAATDSSNCFLRAYKMNEFILVIDNFYTFN